MNRANKRRIIIYPVALLVVATMTFLACQASARDEENLIGTLQNGGELMAKLGLYDRAHENAKKILDLDPDNLYAHLLLAFVHQRKARFEDSIREYELAQGLTRSPEQQQYIELVMADVTRMNEDPEGAIARLDRFKNRHGDHPQAFLIRGQIHMDLDETPVAIKWFQRAVQGKTPIKGAHHALAQAFLKLGDKRNALETLEAAARDRIRIKNLWYRVAVLRKDLGDRAGASRALRSALHDNRKATMKLIEKEKESWGSIPQNLLEEKIAIEG